MCSRRSLLLLSLFSKRSERRQCIFFVVRITRIYTEIYSVLKIALLKFILHVDY